MLRSLLDRALASLFDPWSGVYFAAQFVDGPCLRLRTRVGQYADVIPVVKIRKNSWHRRPSPRSGLVLAPPTKQGQSRSKGRKDKHWEEARYVIHLILFVNHMKATNNLRKIHYVFSLNDSKKMISRPSRSSFCALLWYIYRASGSTM